MIARAIAKYIKISPKKAKLVIDAVRGKSVDEALSALVSINKKASELVREVIESAANNGQRKYPEKKFTHKDLYISKIKADGGPSLVRYKAASMGRAVMIRRRTSHILVELDVIPERIPEEKKERREKAGSLKKPALAGRVA